MSSLDALRKAAMKSAERLEALEKAQSAEREKKRKFADKDIVDEEYVGPTGGRMGLVSPEARSQMRGRVAEMGGVEQFATEISPSVGGAVTGGAIGAIPLLSVPTGGLSIPLGAAFGGIAGELIGQETGVSPESDAGLILSGATIGGPALGAAARQTGKGISWAIRKMPAVEHAVGLLTMQRAAGEMESIGTVIVGNRHGMAASDADVMYAAAKSFAGAELPIENFEKSLSGVRRLIDIYSEFPGMEGATKKVEKALKGVLDEDTKALGMDDVMRVYKSVNELANTAARTPGVTARISDDVFKQFDNDISLIAENSGAKGRGAAFVQGAFKRSRLDRAVQTLERGIAQHIKQAPDSADITLNVEQLRDWLYTKTNPKHAAYDKSLTEELATDLPDIKHQLDKWTKLSAGTLNPAGPGSIVIRNIGARTGSAVVGGMVAGPIGAGIGAMLGSRLPEGTTAVLMSPKGRALMDASLRMGKGSISHKRWAVLAGVAGQAAKPPSWAAENAMGEIMEAEEN